MLLTQRNDHATEEARFRALFDAHYRVNARYVRSRGYAETDVDDLVAGTFEVVSRQLDAVPPGDQAVAWLMGLPATSPRNARRKTQREAAFLADLVPTVSTSGEMTIQERERFAETMRALTQLGPWTATSSCLSPGRS